MNLFKVLFGGNDDVDFHDLIKKGALVVDVRTRSEFKGGHFPDSVNIPVDELQSKLPKLKKQNKPIIVCCASGGRSSAAKQMLINQGITEVFDAGGWRNL